MVSMKMRVARGAPCRQVLRMSLRLMPCLVLFCSLPAWSSAVASSSDWIETAGGRVRLVTSGTPDTAGRLRGALEIALKPGWKTYWRDPGEAGVPPSLDLAESINVSSAEIDFPAPRRFDDGYSVWAGYDRPVSLPVTFTVGKPDRFAAIDATVFLGICEAVCIPVQGMLSLDPGADPDNRQDAATVDAAFTALPSPSRTDFGVFGWRQEGETMIAEARIPQGAGEAELFLAGNGYVFGTPARIERDGKLFFEAPVIDRPADNRKPVRIDYVLATDRGAVAGELPPAMSGQ